jgi:hypothetical protein
VRATLTMPAMDRVYVVETVVPIEPKLGEWGLSVAADQAQREVMTIAGKMQAGEKLTAKEKRKVRT